MTLTRIFRHRLTVKQVVMILAVLVLSLSWALAESAQNLSNTDRDAGHSMLSMIQLDIEKNYYDPNFRGIDLKAKFKAADDQIKQAKSNGEVFSIISDVLLAFDDSHLYFVPPERVTSVRYGWRMQMMGEQCFVTAVEPGSDAEAKGLKTGDEILSIDGNRLSRDLFWKLEYVYNLIRPRTAVKMTLAGTDGRQRQVMVNARLVDKPMVLDTMHNGQRVKERLEQEALLRLQRDRFVAVGNDLLIWKMPSFDDFAESDVDTLMDRAKKYKSLIIDLRGNGGGLVNMLKRLIANVIDHDLKLFDEKQRKETKEVIDKSRKEKAFAGKLVVLVDSESASAAELFARLIQLEKRGTVIGDLTAGAVMESQIFNHQTGFAYAASVTYADLIMTDGKSLEHGGVMPDEFLLPSAADLAAQRDPVLARAAAILGVELTPEKAGTLFPIEWRK